MVVFEARRNRSTMRKPLGAEKRTNKLDPQMMLDLGIEPGPHWWEASALTTASSLQLSYFVTCRVLQLNSCKLSNEYRYCSALCNVLHVSFLLIPC